MCGARQLDVERDVGGWVQGYSIEGGDEEAAGSSGGGGRVGEDDG